MSATSGAVKVGVDSIALPGQLIASPPVSSLLPYSFVATGQGTQYPAPETPPAMTSMTPVGGPSPISSVGGYSTAAARGQAAAAAAAHPMDPKKSAVVPALVMLGTSLVLLYWIFWRNDETLREAVS